MDSAQRRRFVQTVGGGLAFALAGCTDGGEEGEDEEDHDDHGAEGEEGDDEDAEAVGSEGLIYAFAPDTIAVVDPEEGEVVEELDSSGGEWGDPRITQDHAQIFVNEQSAAQVVVIDTETRQIAGEVDVGPDPVHIYNPVEGEIWSHSDAEGSFYVIDTESLEVTDIVEAGLEGEGHGKLLAHPDLGPKAYAMNVNDNAGLVIDLEERERVEEFELDGAGGTHYKAYAPQTGIAYFERSGGPGTAVIDTEEDEMIDSLDIAGGMYLSPNEELLGVLDGEEIHFIDATNEESEIIDSIAVEGEPGALRYHEGDETLYGFTANTTTPDVSVLDLESFEEVDRIETGDVEGEYRAGVAGDEYFFTTADADGTVAIVDMDAQELITEVEVAEGVDTIQYVGDSGVGYTST